MGGKGILRGKHSGAKTPGPGTSQNVGWCAPTQPQRRPWETPLGPSGRERWAPEGRGEAARGPYPLQGWPLPAAARGSRAGGRRRLRGARRRLPCCPAPPPRGDLRRSGSPSACEGTLLRAGGHGAGVDRARTRSAARGRHATARGGARPPEAPPRQGRCCQSREPTNQDSQVLALGEPPMRLRNTLLRRPGPAP